MRFELIDNFDQTIKIPIPESYYDCYLLIKSDYHRYTGRNAGFLRLLLYTYNYSFAFIFWLRLSKYKGWLFPYFKWRLERFGRKYGISISRNVKLGWGFKIVHGIGIVINSSAVIGNNCTIHQFTTIGSDSDNAAIIGDDVYIGPNSCLIENIHIGKNSVIGAGSIVTHDVETDITVAGNPAHKIIPKKQKEVVNPWTLSD